MLAAGLMLALPIGARVKVSTEFDKAFDFRKARTWSWRAEGPGEVRMALTKDDDPDAETEDRPDPLFIQPGG